MDVDSIILEYFVDLRAVRDDTQDLIIRDKVLCIQLDKPFGNVIDSWIKGTPVLGIGFIFCRKKKYHCKSCLPLRNVIPRECLCAHSTIGDWDVTSARCP